MKKLVIVFSFLFFFIVASPVYAGRGCCSWHGGVDYCDADVGRYVCNDGTYSPSCRCHKAPARQDQTPTPTPDLTYSVANIDNSSGDTDSTDNTMAGLAILGGLGAVISLMMGAVVNFFRRPTEQDRRFVYTLMAVQNHHYNHNKTHLVKSENYLEWVKRVDAIDTAVCHVLNITPYQYADLTRRPSIKLLYKREAKRRKREGNKEDTVWYLLPLDWFVALTDFLELKSEENIFYKIVFYPILVVLGMSMMIIVPLGMLFMYVLMYVLIISPIIIAGYLAEYIGWIPAIILGAGLYIVAYWISEKK